MTSMQEEARALGDPTRHRIFRYVAAADRPVGVAELTLQFGLNHNSIRQHLAKLVQAELVDERTARAVGRGRPPLEYSLRPGAAGHWGAPSPYERLSVLLTEMIRTGDSALQVGARAGRRRRTSNLSTESTIDSIVDTMMNQGFAPQLVHVAGDRIEVQLSACPYQAAALADPDTICGLHAGIAHGLTDETSVSVDELIRGDPQQPRCLLRLRVAPKD